MTNSIQELEAERFRGKNEALHEQLQHKQSTQIDQLKTANAAKDAVIQSLETQLKELYKLALKSRDS